MNTKLTKINIKDIPQTPLPPDQHIPGVVRGVALRNDCLKVVSLEAPASVKAPWHTHPRDYFMYVVKGAGSFELENDERLNFIENDFILVPAGVLHRESSEGTDGYQVVIFTSDL